MGTPAAPVLDTAGTIEVKGEQQTNAVRCSSDDDEDADEADEDEEEDEEQELENEDLDADCEHDAGCEDECVNEGGEMTVVEGSDDVGAAEADSDGPASDGEAAAS